MTIWGLNGLAALDPDLNTTLQDNQIRLYGPDQLIIAVPAPPPNDADGLGQGGGRRRRGRLRRLPGLAAGRHARPDRQFLRRVVQPFRPLFALRTTAAGRPGPADDHRPRRHRPHASPRRAADVVVGRRRGRQPGREAGLAAGSHGARHERPRRSIPARSPRLNAAMNGIAGSTVTLRLQDPDDIPARPRMSTLTRAFIPPQTVFTEDRGRLPGILALKITGFNKGTSDQFSAALVARHGGHPAAARPACSICAAIAAACCARPCWWRIRCCPPARSSRPPGATRMPTRTSPPKARTSPAACRSSCWWTARPPAPPKSWPPPWPITAAPW